MQKSKLVQPKMMTRKCTTQKMKFSIKDFFSKCDQIRRKLQIWSHLLKKSLMENFIFCVVMISTIINVCLVTKEFKNHEYCYNNYKDKRSKSDFFVSNK